MEIIRSLAKMSRDQLFDAFARAFKDYEIQIDQNAWSEMVIRRGFVPELSFGAFVDNQLVSFTFNGIGLWNGVKTAYDTGTGTIKEFRGKGLATKVFNHSIPYLKEAGITQYLLEVLQHNEKAVSVYRKIGFKVAREFNYFSHKMSDIKINPKSLSDEYIVKEINLAEKEQMETFWDFVPSWQNSFESIERTIETYKMLGAYKEQRLVGYCIFEPNTGDITQIAVQKDHRRKGIATNLLNQLLHSNKIETVKLVNTKVECESITKFIENQGIVLRGTQYEMWKKL